MDRQRSRSLLEELPTILTYPFVDITSFVLLTLFIGIISALGTFALFGGGYAVLFSQGLLMAYTFSAMYRVSNGNMKSYMPDVGDIFDLVTPLWLGAGAFLISSAPLILLIIYFPLSMFGIVKENHRQVPEAAQTSMASFAPDGSTPVLRVADEEDSEDDAMPTEDEAEDDSVAEDDEEEEGTEWTEEEEDDSEPDESDATVNGNEEDAAWLGGDDEDEYSEYSYIPSHIKLLFFLALIWKIAYGPAALAVAGITRSFLQTINPLVGIDSIQRIGFVYWQAVGIYAVISLAKFLLGLPLSGIPVLGTFVKATIGCYASLITGCMLGLVILKKSRELGLE